MTDLNKLRSEFEVIPEIKAHLDHGNVFWSDKNQTYASEFQCLHAVACYVNGAWFMFQEKAKAQAVPETHVVVPKGVLDLTRFMCKTWAEIDNFVYKNCTNLGEYPVIQGTSNQFNLAKIGNQKVDHNAIHSAVKWFLESESGAEG